MNIYGIDGQPIITNIRLNANCKHEEEMMKSNFVKLSFRHSKKRELPIGAYVVVDGIKYFLLDPYLPTQQKDDRFQYEPEFQHPIMWLGKLPFIHKQGDTTSWATTVKKYVWSFTGSPTTLANEVAIYINWLGSVYPQFAEAIGTEWTARVIGNLPASETFNFNSVDILSGAAEMANVCNCEYHFDYVQRVFYFGEVGFLRAGDSKPVLKSGKNVGIASITQSKEPYYNCFVVKGGTRNISQVSPSGDNVQVTERLSLDKSKYPDSIIDIREGNGEPMLVKEMLFDDIYPKMQLYIYQPRERLCYLLDAETGEKVPDPNDPTGYKTYAKWYIRLAYLKDGEWHDYTINPDTDLIKDKPLSLVFQPNYDSDEFTSPLIGREFELVYFDKQTKEKEDDDVNPDGYTAQAGEYRIVFVEGDIILPTTSRSGLNPKGYDYPSTENNIVTLFNIVVDDVYKEIASNELEEAGLKAIARLKKDLNTYTLSSNPVYFEKFRPSFYVGQAVTYDDGQDLNNGGTSYRLDTHIRKIITRLDCPDCVEISIGNEQIKGTVSSLSEKVESLAGGLIAGLTEEQFEELLTMYGSKHFLSKEYNDIAQGIITFLRGAKFGSFVKGEKGALINNTGDGEFRRILTRGLATLQELFVKGDAVFNQNLSSPDFISGFPNGTGWALQKKEFINSAGEVEYKYVLECDGANIRGSLRVYEFIISQLLGENDNRIFTAMLEVHHYDPETGKVWLRTNGGKFYMPFRVNDCIMVAQYQPGGDVVSGGDGYITKDYELLITEVGTGGEVDENGDRLDWVKFTNFSTMMTGATPETLIADHDTFCRVDNLTDPERKGIIQMITVGTNAPYMDIIYGIKTDPDGALKGRLGNLQGIHHHLFGWLQEFGEYLINAYIVGDVRLRRTGESLDTAVEILKGLIASKIAETVFEVTDDDNYLRNAEFTELDEYGKFRDWTTTGDNVNFFTLDDSPVVSSLGTLADVRSCVKTEMIDGRQVLHIANGSIRQSHSVMKAPTTHKEYDNPSTDQTDTYKTVRDTLFVGCRIRCIKGGTLSIGFPESTMTEQGAINGRTMVIERSSEWQTIEVSGTWDGQSDFVLSFDGECYITSLSMTDEPLSNFKVEYSTQIQQTSRNISLIASRTSTNETNIARIDVTARQIQSTVESNYNSLDGRITTNTSKITQTANAIRQEVSESVDGLSTRIGTLETTSNSVIARVQAIEGNYVTQAEMGIYIKDEDGVLISHAKIAADKIQFNLNFDWKVYNGNNDLIFHLNNQGDLAIAGKFHGEFDNTVVFGTGTKKMYIEPTAEGARLIGKDGSYETLHLGFRNYNGSMVPAMYLNAQNGSNTQDSTIRIMSGSDFAEVLAESAGSTGAYHIIRMISYPRYGYGTIEGNKWPKRSDTTVYNRLSNGAVYVEDGYLKVKGW